MIYNFFIHTSSILQIVFHSQSNNYSHKKLEIMKKSKFQSKLSLNKETVARLNDAQMNNVQGGSILLQTIKCIVIQNIPTRPVPTCTISTNTFDKTILDQSGILNR